MKQYKILELCHKVAPGAQPVFIAINPDPRCDPGDCFANVRRKVLQEGGRIQYGWALWEWPGVFIEAEHHSVYEPSAGSAWHDLTPCPRGSSRLFLPDDSATYDFESEGVRRDNVRLALSDGPLIDAFFKAGKNRTAFYNQLPGVGMLSIRKFEDKERHTIERRLARAVAALAEKYGRNERI